MLDVKDLIVKVADKQILNAINLQVSEGEVHAIMGPNGSGKSTLVNFLAGNPNYKYISGAADFLQQDLLEMEIDDRAKAGLFLGFQYPVEISGVNNAYFIRTVVNATREAQGLDPIDAYDFLQIVREKMQILGVGVDESERWLARGLNCGFSGGEKKRNEILQMLCLQPKLALLDEIDSGLDIDALQHVANGINALRSEKTGVLMVTHYQRLLRYVKPDVVHVMINGDIVESGDIALADYLEQHGYAKWQQEVA